MCCYFSQLVFCISLQAWKVPLGSTRWMLQLMTVVRSALRTGRLYPMKYSWYSVLLEAESTLVRQEGCQCEIWMTLSGIERSTSCTVLMVVCACTPCLMWCVLCYEEISVLCWQQFVGALFCKFRGIGLCSTMRETLLIDVILSPSVAFVPYLHR